jgi:tRNA (adenine22-N1)-methyltransferase
MGGELISRIVLSSALSRKAGVRLILQPMTHTHDLRRDLFANGFNIADETLVKDRDRVYQIIVAEYDGIVRTATQSELWLGKKNIERGGEDLRALASLYAFGLEKKIKGYAEAGKTDQQANELYCELKKLAETVN